VGEGVQVVVDEDAIWVILLGARASISVSLAVRPAATVDDTVDLAGSHLSRV